MRPIIFTCIILLFTGLLWVGCGPGMGQGQKNGPEAVAQDFLTALQYGDYDGAKKLATPETRKSLDFYESTAKLGANNFEKDFEIVNSEINSDYARVYYLQDHGKDQKVLTLRRENKLGWQVILSKADLNNTDVDVNGSTKDDLFDDRDQTVKPTHLQGASEAAWDFLNALRFGDFESAKKMGTKETKDALDMQTGLLGSGNNPYDRKFEILREEVTGKYAKVYYKQEGEDQENFIKLREDFGNGWLIIMSKSELQEVSDSDASGNPLQDLGDQLEKKAREIEEELEEDEH